MQDHEPQRMHELNKALLQRLGDRNLVRTGFISALAVLAANAVLSVRNKFKLKETSAWVNEAPPGATEGD